MRGTKRKAECERPFLVAESGSATHAYFTQATKNKNVFSAEKLRMQFARIGALTQRTLFDAAEAGVFRTYLHMIIKCLPEEGESVHRVALDRLGLTAGERLRTIDEMVEDLLAGGCETDTSASYTALYRKMALPVDYKGDVTELMVALRLFTRYNRDILDLIDACSASLQVFLDLYDSREAVVPFYQFTTEQLEYLQDSFESFSEEYHDRVALLVPQLQGILHHLINGNPIPEELSELDIQPPTTFYVDDLFREEENRLAYIKEEAGKHPIPDEAAAKIKELHAGGDAEEALRMYALERGGSRLALEQWIEACEA